MKTLIKAITSLTLCVISSAAQAEYPTGNETSQQVATRILGGFSRCAGAMIAGHRDEIHQAIMMNMDVSLPMPIFNFCAGSGYIIFCTQAGHDERSCYDDLRRVINAEIDKAGVR